MKKVNLNKIKKEYKDDNTLCIYDKTVTCSWCSRTFDTHKRFVQGEVDITKEKYGKKGSVSSQIKCPYCLNFNETFPKVKIGNKHIHDGRT